MKVLNTNNIKTTSAYTGPNKTRKYKYNGKWVIDHHYGIDIVGNEDVLAQSSGKVIKVVNKGSNGGVMCQVRIQHDIYQSAYYHLKSGSILVKKGDYVKEGTKIATMGNTGKSSGKHLHFQVDKGTNATSINPTDYAYGRKTLAPLIKWENGTYELLYHKYLRSTPEVKTNNKIKYSALKTQKAKDNCVKDALGYAKTKIGVNMKLSDFTKDSKGNIWGKTTNGKGNYVWLCVEDKTGKQVKKV